ncbi:MAG: NERD domain-containing protein [Erysipelotrichaceae bacterium]|nr:NERD domain-containing protein [Erysipelotrichaceae bacterium]
MLLLVTLFLAVIFVIICLYYKDPGVKGQIGESQIVDNLSFEGLKGHKGVVLRNLYIPRPNGTTEADIVYITSKGIFVIESKNYAGYIFGSGNHKHWTVSLYTGKNYLGFKTTTKLKLYNPVWQNSTHINALRNYLQGNIKYYSLIVFSDRASLMEINVNKPYTYVINKSDLGSVISNIWRREQDTLTESDINRIASRLAPLQGANKQKKDEHLQSMYVRQHHTAKCPKCGGDLVLRTARKGPNAGKQFYGCSKYPKCTYTRNLD